MNKSAFTFFEQMARIHILLPGAVMPIAFLLLAVAVGDYTITFNVIHGIADSSSLENRRIIATLPEYNLIIAVCLALLVAMAVLATLILVGRWVRNNRGISLE
ncbi:MAG: hypothetical protein ACREAY_01285 [Nitrososphaera sp.]|uniref:hypothetical protein n=1 Tax=Nitrososphaera sp. TaxID=1971748 RepID=UPI003D6FEF4F